MSALTWDAGTLATGGQLLMAATIAVHLLVVRPRAARENLALSARIIGDDVTLDQNHGLLPIRDPEVERVRQLVARVVQDPTTAKNVLLGAEAELAADPGAPGLPTVDRIRVEAYLTRLADACSRYQHDAWPFTAGAQLPRHAFRPSARPVTAPPLDDRFEEELPLENVAVEQVYEPLSLVPGPDEPAGPRRIDLDEAAEEQVEAEPADAGERRVVTRLPTSIDLTARPAQAEEIVRVPAPRWRQPGS